jgi:hypothetical protein
VARSEDTEYFLSLAPGGRRSGMGLPMLVLQPDHADAFMCLWIRHGQFREQEAV